MSAIVYASCTCCPQCRRVDVELRDDGTLRNHRDVSGAPCEGSRTAPGRARKPKASTKAVVTLLRDVGGGWG
jgi:membrane protein involved in colicin uptake